MNEKKKSIITRWLAIFALAPWSIVALFAGSCFLAEPVEDSDASPWMEMAAVHNNDSGEVDNMSETIVVPPVEEPRVAERTNPNTVNDQYVALCEASVAVVEIDPITGKEILPKRRKITKTEQNRMRDQVRLIAQEMGADPKLFLIWALRESSYRWYKRHQLNPDMEAASVAWGKYRYSESRESELMAIAPGAAGYWEAKAELDRRSVYKNNPTYEASWRWATGYGLFGAQPVYHLKRWDPTEAPEILCDPVVATITAIWAARSVKSVCSSTGYGDTYEAVNRGYSTGHCEPNSRPGLFKKRAERIGLDHTAPAQLGSKWPQKSTDRAEILAYMRQKIAEAETAEAK